MGPTFSVYAVFFAVRLANSLTYGVVLLILRRANAYNFIPPVIPPPTQRVGKLDAVVKNSRNIYAFRWSYAHIIPALHGDDSSENYCGSSIRQRTLLAGHFTPRIFPRLLFTR